MNIGAHVSISGGIFLSPERSKKLGGNIFQFFSRSPRGGGSKKINHKDKEMFLQNMQKYSQITSYIHAPYYINLASSNNKIRWGSISALKEELKRANTLNVKGVITHLGSAKDYGFKQSLNKTVKSIIHILEKYKGDSFLILEQSAGAGGENGIIGGKIEDLGFIYNHLGKYRKYVKFCIDTCHAFAMGYDLTKSITIEEYLKSIKKHIGINNLLVIHANDSKFPLESHKDRHEHIGKGYIGIDGFKKLLNHKLLKGKDIIIETPTEKGMKKDIKILKKILS